MIDIRILQVMLGLTEADGIYPPIREQKMVMEEIEYMAAKLQYADFNTTMTVPTTVLRSILRAWLSAELGMRQHAEREAQAKYGDGSIYVN